MNKMEYTAPETEIVEFEITDVIVTSGDDDETQFIPQV